MTRAAPAEGPGALFEMLEHLPFRLAEPAAARIGVVVLASDYTLEQELRAALAVPGVDAYVARIANSPVITPESLRAMGEKISATVDLILPGEPLDVCAFACTSASMVLGEDAVAAAIHEARPEARATNPITAAFRAFEALGARRVAVLTPYRRDVNDIVLDHFRARGVEVPVFGSFNQDDDRTVARIDSESIRAAVRRLVQGRAVDAVFISCTTVRALGVIPAMEAETGLPVVTANQALAWDCLRLAGALSPRPGLGRLFAAPR